MDLTRLLTRSTSLLLLATSMVGTAIAQTHRSAIPEIPPYAGPAGGGTPPYRGPTGGGEPNPAGTSMPNPNPPPPEGGSPQPRWSPSLLSRGWAPSGGFGPPPSPAPPVGPIPAPAAPVDPRGRLVPRTLLNLTPHGLPYPTDRWENWWTLNKDRYLDVGRTFALRSRASELGADEFLGARPAGDGAAPILEHRERLAARVGPDLMALLDHESAIVRGEAALALGKIGGRRDVPALRRASLDTNRFVRQLALLGLGLTQNQDALVYLSGYLVDPSNQDADRVYAALGLGAMGREDALAPLATVIYRSECDRQLKAAALYALGFVPGPESIALLQEFVARLGTAGDLRAAAILGLGKRGDVSLTETLLRGLKDPETHVRRSSALALGQGRYESILWMRREALEQELARWEKRGLVSPAARLRFEEHLLAIEKRAKAEALALQKTQRRVVAELGQVLDRERDRMTRHFAAIALGRIASPEARAELVRGYRANAGNYAFRGFLSVAIGLAGAKDAAPLLRRQLAQKGLDPSSRGAILLALGLLGDVGSGDEMTSLALERANPEVRSFAALSVGLMDYRAAAEDFRRELAQESQAYLKPVFGLSLALLGDWDALAVLEKLMNQSASNQTKAQAAQALGYVRDLGSLDILLRTLKSKDLTDATRATVAHAVGQVAEKGELPVLEPLARDWNYLLPFPLLNEALVR